MMSRYSPSSIIRGQVKFLMSGRSPVSGIIGVAAFFLVPLASPIIQGILGLHLDKDTVATVVSAASIFAGLLLNLLVLLQGMIPQASESSQDIKSEQQLRAVVESAFYCISYAVLVSAMLVMSSLVVLSRLPYITAAFEYAVYYFGLQLLFSIAQILKISHDLFGFKMTGVGSARAQTAETVWTARKGVRLAARQVDDTNRDRPAA